MSTRPQIPALVILLGTVAIASAPVRGAEGGGHIQVSAGAWDRREVVVSFLVPEIQSNASYLLDADGSVIPLQIDEKQRGSFVLRNLKAGESRTFRFGAAPADLSAHGRIEFVRAGKKLQAAQDGARILDYQAEPGLLPRPDVNALFIRGGYLHPILSPAGKAVSDDFPRDHIHHHGIWFPWTKTEFEGRKPDFWNMGDGTGKVEFESVSSIWSGLVHGGFIAHHRFIDLTAPKPKVVLKETWRVTVYNVGRGSNQYRMFDLISVQKCASSSPLILPQYRYGGLGFRGNQSWNGAENAFFLTSEGETDRIKAHATRGRWCHIGGQIDGQWAGIAILCHPSNFRAPQPMRVHPTEPFFNFAPSQAGDWQIKPGEEYVSKYRFIVTDGRPDKAELDRIWNDYAHPPKVAVH